MKKLNHIGKIHRSILWILGFGFVDNLSTRLGFWKLEDSTFYACIIGGGVGLLILVILELFSRRAKKPTEENNS